MTMLMGHFRKRASANNGDAEVRVFERKPGLTPGSTVENVVVGGRTRGFVMRRTPHYVVWAEAAQEVHVQGNGLTTKCVARMWEGPRGAAVSDDEQWCVVIGLGFLAFPLRPGTDVRSHWRHPAHERWQLHQPMTGDLADAILFTGVQALDGHRFSLSTRWGRGNGWTTREWIYNADTDTIGEPRDIIDEAKRGRAARTETSAAYAGERQLAAALRSDGAESTAEAGTTFAPSPNGGEMVLSKGNPVGRVLQRSPRFVVWQELGSVICVEGDGLPWLVLDDMYGGASAAAISADEEWCVVVGCGFRVRRLRVAGEFRSHGADPGNILWLSNVESVDGHIFRLHGGSAGFVVREYLYDADRDVLHLDREWFDEERRVRTDILQSFVDQPLEGVDITSGQTRLRFGTTGELEVTIAREIRLEEGVPGRGVGTVNLHDDAHLREVEAMLQAWRGIRVGAVTIESHGGIRFQLHAGRNGTSKPPLLDWFGIAAPLSIPGSWSVTTPKGRLDAPAGPAVASRSAPAR
jgi:hypothetical protein